MHDLYRIITAINRFPDSHASLSLSSLGFAVTLHASF